MRAVAVAISRLVRAFFGRVCLHPALRFLSASAFPAKGQIRLLLLMAFAAIMQSTKFVHRQVCADATRGRVLALRVAVCRQSNKLKEYKFKCNVWSRWRPENNILQRTLWNTVLRRPLLRTVRAHTHAHKVTHKR